VHSQLRQQVLLVLPVHTKNIIHHDAMCYTFLKPTTLLAWSRKHYTRDPITLKSCRSPACYKGKTRLHNYDHSDISIIYAVKEILMNFQGNHRQ
jgi:hypothetical protein